MRMKSMSWFASSAIRHIVTADCECQESLSRSTVSITYIGFHDQDSACATLVLSIKSSCKTSLYLGFRLTSSILNFKMLSLKFHTAN